MTLRTISIAVAALLGASYVYANPPAVNPPAVTVMHTVAQGETLFTLGQNYFISPAAQTQVQRLNAIANPRQIPIGTVLKIPRNLLRDEVSQGQLEAFSGQVLIRSGGQVHAAKLGEKLPEGAEIECGRNSFATLRLADDSALSIPSQSVLRLTWLRKVKLTGALERQIDLKAGRMGAKVTPMTNPNSNFRVVTPVAVSAVRGTEFRVAYDGDAAFSAAQVDGGKVAFDGSPGSAELLLPTGFGAADVKGQATGVVKLLAPPKLEQPEKVQSDERLSFTLAPLSEASKYHLQIARDAGFLETIAEDLNTAPTFDMPSLPADSYFVRVSAVDAVGLEGTAQTYAFERRRNLISGTAEAGAPGERRMRFKWGGIVEGTPQYRFQLIRKGTPNQPVVDEAGLSANLVTVSNLGPGEYMWRVNSTLFVKGKVVSKWTEPQSFSITKAK